MATGLEALAGRLKESCASGEQFNPEACYEATTDSLIYYHRDVPSYSKRINRYLTVFLSDADESLVGIEIKGLSVISSAVENLGNVKISDPVRVNDEDGESVDLSVFVRCSLVPEPDVPFDANDYAEIERVAKGVRIHSSLCASV